MKFDNFMRYWPCVIDLNKSSQPDSSIIIFSAKYRPRCECKTPKILSETFGNNNHKSFKKTSCYEGNEIMNQVSSYLFEATQLENNFNSKKRQWMHDQWMHDQWRYNLFYISWEVFPTHGLSLLWLKYKETRTCRC